jgi:hypothetical protein
MQNDELGHETESTKDPPIELGVHVEPLKVKAPVEPPRTTQKVGEAHDTGPTSGSGPPGSVVICVHVEPL